MKSDSAPIRIFARFPLLFALLLALGMGFALAGCRQTQKVFVSPYTNPANAQGTSPTVNTAGNAAAKASLEELSRALAARHPEWDTLQALADIVIYKGKKARGTFNANLLVSLPDRARLRGSKVGIGTFFEIISDGDLLHVHLNKDGLLFSGRAEDLPPDAGVLRAASTEGLLGALLAERDLARRLRQSSPASIVTRPAHWIIRIDSPAENRWQVWVVRRNDFLVEETLIGRPGAGTEARIRYWGYRLFGEEPLPSDLEIHLAGQSEWIRVDVDTYKVNPTLPPVIFAPPRVSPDHHYPLSSLHFRVDSTE